MTEIVSITQKGQATLPVEFRKKHGFGNRALVVDTPDRILFKLLPAPSDDAGSLKDLFQGKSSREVLAEARQEDQAQDTKLRRHLDRSR